MSAALAPVAAAESPATSGCGASTADDPSTRAASGEERGFAADEARTSAAAPFLRADELPSREVDARLRDALCRYDAAHGEVILWLAEVVDRRLYRDFDCSSPRQYALLRLGLSRTRAGYFLRMVRSFAELPALRAAVASGELPWTKARQVVRVATPETQERWVEVARELPREALERRVARAKAAAAMGRKLPGQAELGLIDGGSRNRSVCRLPGLPDADTGGDAVVSGGAANADGFDADVKEVPLSVTLRFTPEQLARLEALMERARRCGARGSREELILAGMEALGDEQTVAKSERGSVGVAEGHHGDPRPGHPGGQFVPNGDPGEATRGTTSTTDAAWSAEPARRRSTPRYQVIVQQCESCGRAEVPTSHGPLPIDASTLRTILCDARVKRPGKRNRATIAPSVRREVLARDRHRCRAPGCGSSRFLDVHHRVPRSAGGTNDAANLITLCSACHRLVHEKRLAPPRTG